jgi:hypothetical protein
VTERHVPGIVSQVCSGLAMMRDIITKKGWPPVIYTRADGYQFTADPDDLEAYETARCTYSSTGGQQVSRFPGAYEVEVGGAANVGESYEQAAARELAEALGIRALPRLLFTFINRSGVSPHWLGMHEVVVPDAVVPDPDEVAWHGWLTEPELRSALLEWRFTPHSHEVFGRYLAFRTVQS